MPYPYHASTQHNAADNRLFTKTSTNLNQSHSAPISTQTAFCRCFKTLPWQGGVGAEIKISMLHAHTDRRQGGMGVRLHSGSDQSS